MRLINADSIVEVALKKKAEVKGEGGVREMIVNDISDLMISICNEAPTVFEFDDSILRK